MLQLHVTVTSAPMFTGKVSIHPSLKSKGVGVVMEKRGWGQFTMNFLELISGVPHRSDNLQRNV